MSDHIDPTDHAALSAWRDNHKNTYIESGGVHGHVIDLREMGAYRFSTMLLLRCTGRKSGRSIITPLHYSNVKGEVVIVGSNGGGPTDPQWYHNIVAGGPVAFQVGTQAFEASWREPPSDTERDKLWEFMIEMSPHYAMYRTMTTRRIPLILLTAGEEIPVFTHDDEARP